MCGASVVIFSITDCKQKTALRAFPHQHSNTGCHDFFLNEMLIQQTPALQEQHFMVDVLPYIAPHEMCSQSNRCQEQIESFFSLSHFPSNKTLSCVTFGITSTAGRDAHSLAASSRHLSAHLRRRRCFASSCTVCCFPHTGFAYRRCLPWSLSYTGLSTFAAGKSSTSVGSNDCSRLLQCGIWLWCMAWL